MSLSRLSGGHDKMASKEGEIRTGSASKNDRYLPKTPGRADVAGPPSIISSRMTDIASEDGRDAEALRRPIDYRMSNLTSDSQRLSLARMSALGDPGTWTQQPPRRGLAGHRASASGSLANPMAGGRLISSSRSHVPSLTSHAFFHPMSSQKLQAQRGASRPSTRASHPVPPEESLPSESGQRSIRHSQASTYTSRVATIPKHDDNEVQRPGSGGTIATIMEMRGKKSDTSLPAAAMGSSRSFRSSFLLPARPTSSSTGRIREMPGREKLESADSTPCLPPNMETKVEDTAVERVMLKFGRTHEYFQGNTVFCIGGRLQNTRDRPVNIGTGTLVVLPSILFFVFSAPWVWVNISPALPIIYAYIFYICMSSFLHASGSNPGILPRNLHRFPPADEDEDPLRLAPSTTDWTLVKSTEKTAAAMEVPVKFCKTCNIWRPPRAHHCRLCDNCIETQDHHCVWLNNCVGRRNYRYFFTFVTSTSLLAAYLVGVSVAQLAIYSDQTGLTFGDAIDHFRVPFAMAVYGVLAFVYPAALMGYHVFLMVRGETTREYLNSLKFLKKERYRPFAQPGLIDNLVAVLCRPRPPTYHRFRENFRPGDQRYGARRVAGKPAESREGVEMHAVRPQSGFQGPAALRNEHSSAAGVSGT